MHFKPSKFGIRGENREEGQVRVVKFETGPGPQVKDYSLPDLAEHGKGSYGAIKAKYGPLAATDQDRQARGQKESRFAVNPLLRDSLAIEQEERRVIERRVSERVGAVHEQAKAEGFKQGYEEGLKQGRNESFEQFHQEAQESMSSFQSMVQSMESLKGEVFKANERFLMELVFQMTKMITLKEVSTDPQYVLRISQQLMETIGIRENVKIRIHPKDLAFVDQLKSQLTQSFSDLKNLTIETSEDVAGGGCKLETQWSAIDASLERQLKGLQEAITASTEAKGS